MVLRPHLALQQKMPFQGHRVEGSTTSLTAGSDTQHYFNFQNEPEDIYHQDENIIVSYTEENKSVSLKTTGRKLTHDRVVKEKTIRI